MISARTRRRAFGVVVAIGLTGWLTACSWGDPPDDVVAEAEAYVEAVRDVDGVGQAQVNVRAFDPKDRPGVWVTQVVVDASSADDLDDLPARVAGVEAPSSSRLDLTLRFAATEAYAPVILSAVPGLAVPDLAVPAAILRSLPVVERVTLNGVTDSVALVPGTDLAEAAELIRAAAPWSAFGSLYLHRDEGSIDITATTPSSELLRLLESVSADPSVEHLSLRLSENASRGTLIIETTDPERLAVQLRDVVGITDQDPPVRFVVHSDDDDIDGCLGGVSC